MYFKTNSFNKKPIRALLLSAGLGKRLRPITYIKPKCLVEINGNPIMEYWLRKLESIGCEKVLINTHYLSEEVDKFLSIRKKSSMIIESIFEKELLGTASTLINNRKFFRESTTILIHADNMTNFKISSLVDFHNEREGDNCLLTMLTFNTDYPSSCGIVITDKQNILRGFYEKIKNPPSNIANAAIYVFGDKFLENLIKEVPLAKDFSKDVIPNYLGRVRTFHTEKLIVDIGTPERLALARSKFKNNN